MTKTPLPDLQGVRVLIVDDDSDALVLASEVLASAGARVVMAASALEALAQVDDEVPDVIVADLGMPKMDGFEFIHRVRQHGNPTVRQIPAAAMTAYARSDDRIRTLKAGFQIHLSKPIDPVELMFTIAALARRFESRRLPGTR